MSMKFCFYRLIMLTHHRLYTCTCICSCFFGGFYFQSWSTHMVITMDLLSWGHRPSMGCCKLIKMIVSYRQWSICISSYIIFWVYWRQEKGMKGVPRNAVMHVCVGSSCCIHEVYKSWSTHPPAPVCVHGIVWGWSILSRQTPYL